MRIGFPQRTARNSSSRVAGGGDMAGFWPELRDRLPQWPCLGGNSVADVSSRESRSEEAGWFDPPH